MLNSKNEAKRGVLRVRLVGDADNSRADVRASLGALGDPPLELIEAETGGDSDDAADPDVVMVLFNGGNEDESLAYLQTQAEKTPRPALFALMHERSPVLMRRILRAGADELLFLPLDQGDVTRALLKISETRRRAERRSGGIVCAVVSTVGGVGVTSLAGNLALALRCTLNKRVAILDLDLQTDGMAVFLNLEPERTIMQLCETDRRLDSIQLESVLTKHPSGIYLLAAPKRIEDGELVADTTVSAVIDLMRQLFDFVIVDCGGYIDENAVAAWERADYLLYLLDQSISGARCAWRFVDLFSRLGLSGVEPSFVLSRYVPHHPISEDQIIHTLGRPIYAKIPRDERLLERVQLRAQDLWQVAPASPLARAIEGLARRINSGGEVAAESNGSFVSRLFSAFTNHRN
ncbi:MAG TPA: AAA family ATPase [Candidatus Binataceae bacterium]|nr:AAA family ATPase [Candidatus Binataceae bacterium]